MQTFTESTESLLCVIFMRGITNCVSCTSKEIFCIPLHICTFGFHTALPICNIIHLTWYCIHIKVRSHDGISPLTRPPYLLAINGPLPVPSPNSIIALINYSSPTVRAPGKSILVRENESRVQCGGQDELRIKSLLIQIYLTTIAIAQMFFFKSGKHLRGAYF